MCLSTVYAKKEDKMELICKNIADVRVDDKNLSFVDIMGITTKYVGVISRIDLTENNIYVMEA